MELLNLIFTKTIIIYFIIGIIIYLALYFISKTLLRIFTFITTVLLIIILIVGFFAINDAMKFSNTLKENNAIFLLEKNNNYIAGLEYNFETNDYKIFSSEDILEEQKKIIEEKKYDNKTYFIINYSFLEKQNFTIKENPGLPEFLLDKNRILKIISSEKPLEEYANLYYDNHKEVQVKNREEFINFFVTQMKEQGYTNVKLKSELFSLMLAVIMKENPNFLFEGMKEKTIKVYPERIFIKLFDYIPEDQFKNILEFSTQKLEEKINTT